MNKLNDYLNSVRDKNIHIVGAYGTEGRAIATFLRKHQISNVTLHDLSTKTGKATSLHQPATLEEFVERSTEIKKLGNYKHNLGENYLKDIEKADIIFAPQSWRIYPENKPLLSRTSVMSSITELYLKLLPRTQTIGVTGSNGKGTTTAMLHHLIPNSILTGNDRATKPILSDIENLKPDQWIILEISNRQLDQIQASPHIAVLLNITENHLDEYNSLQDYTNTKAKIFQFQNPDDHCFLNQDDPNTAQLSSKIKSNLHSYELNIQNQNLIVNTLSIPLADLPIQGNHNLSNLTVAIQVAQHIGLPDAQIIELAKTFQPLQDRQQPIRTIGQTTYYNDRQGTSIDATIQALNTLPKPLVLIFGGENKGMPAHKLAESITSNCQLAIGIVSPFVDEIAPLIPNLKQVSTMTEAVNLAATLNANTVLFSPACSYGPYFMHQDKPDYLDFTKLVNML